MYVAIGGAGADGAGAFAGAFGAARASVSHKPQVLAHHLQVDSANLGLS